jgi:hypothetical protein
MILLSGKAWDISRRFLFSTPRKSTRDTFSRVMTFSTKCFTNVTDTSKDGTRGKVNKGKLPMYAFSEFFK